MTSVDRIQGLSGSLAVKAPVRVATTANITLSGLQTVDGVALAEGDRVLVKDQSDTTQNGIYLANTGTWTRSLDFDGANDVVQGTAVSIQQGTAYALDLWQVTTASPAPGAAMSFAQMVPNDSDTVGYQPAGTGAVATTVSAYLNLKVKGLKKTFGAVGDGTTDDAVPLANAIASGKIIEAEDYTFAIGGSQVINTDYTRLYGAGIGSTIFKRIGSAGEFFKLQSAGGVSPTKIGIDLRDFTIDGNSIATNALYAYDVAHLNLSGIETKGATGWGANIEMCVSPRIQNSKFSSNAKGLRLAYGVKNALDYETTEAEVIGCWMNSNTNQGLSLDGAFQAHIIGGDISANANGILMTGSRRCVIEYPYMENNTTDHINTAIGTATVPVNCEDTEFHLRCYGTGAISHASGINCLFDGYLVGALTLSGGAAIAGTILMPRLYVAGTVTDGGNSTQDLRPTAVYVKQSSAKRYQRSIGSTVDYTSDIAAYRYGQIKGLSGSATLSNNFTGYKDIADAATTAAVTFGTAEADAGYGIVFGVWDVAGTPASGSRNAYMTSRATGGFTINVQAAPGAGNTVRVQWMLVR